MQLPPRRGDAPLVRHDPEVMEGVIVQPVHRALGGVAKSQSLKVSKENRLWLCDYETLRLCDSPTLRINQCVPHRTIHHFYGCAVRRARKIRRLMESIASPHLWIIFSVFVLGMLALDLGVFNRKAHEVRFREALTWSFIWVALSMAFNWWIYHEFGSQKALEFLTGYLIEKALSVDNIFVFVVLFASFAVPKIYQHRVLFWGG